MQNCQAMSMLYKKVAFEDAKGASDFFWNDNSAGVIDLSYDVGICKVRGFAHRKQCASGDVQAEKITDDWLQNTR